MSNPITDAAFNEVFDHGLHGRTDSPPEWNEVLQDAVPSDPILVKDPEDPRDDFYLVPLNPKNKLIRRGAWVILDSRTLKMREASLLNDWKAATFPDEKDQHQMSQTTVTFPDGSSARYSQNEIRPNLKNLVWKPSEASILPYWPVKEFTVPHPITGVQTPIYMTQEGVILTSLEGESPQESTQSQPTIHPAHSPSKSSFPPSKFLTGTTLALAAALIFMILKPAPTTPDPGPLKNQIAFLEDAQSSLTKDRDQWRSKYEELLGDNRGNSAKILKDLAVEKEFVRKLTFDLKNEKDINNKQLKKLSELEKDTVKKDAQIEELLKVVARWQETSKTLTADRDRFKKQYEDLRRTKNSNPTSTGTKENPAEGNFDNLRLERTRLIQQIARSKNETDLRTIKQRLEEIDQILGSKK